MKKNLIVHPFLFASYPLLFILSNNISETPLSDVMLPLLVVFLFVAVSFFFLGKFLKDFQKSGIIVSIFLFLFFSYGHVYEALTELLNVRHRYLLSLFSVLFFAVTYFCVKFLIKLEKLTKMLNLTSSVLVITSLFTIGNYYFNHRTDFILDRETEFPSNAISLNAYDKEPDIYYIILDAYNNEENLKEIYSYDNREFTTYLREKGFFIPRHAHSNYALTFLSLASSLNMEYVNHYNPNPRSKKREKFYQRIRKNDVIKFLKSKGYEIIAVDSGWPKTNLDASLATVYSYDSAITEYLSVLIQSTALKIFQEQFLAMGLRNQRLYAFSKLREIPRTIDRKKFVFSHIICPHPPNLFDQNGNALSRSLKLDGPSWDDKKSYLRQVKFANKKIKEIIEEIFKYSKGSPIIIIQADHGSASSFNHEYAPPITDAMIRERMGNLNAIFLPERKAFEVFDDSITPVNLFRVIFNTYFGTDYQLLENKNYFSIYQSPYTFSEVRHKLIF